MNIHEYLYQCRNNEQQRIHNLRVERTSLKSTIDGENHNLVRNSHCDWAMKEAKERLAQSTKRLAEVEKAIASPWQMPAPKKCEELESLYRLMDQAERGRYIAESALTIAVNNERPRAEAQVRQELAECERDAEKYRKQLRKGLEAVHVDPAPFCGRAV